MYFKTEQISYLTEGLAEVGAKYATLQQRLVLYGFRTAGGREHAHHGLARRLGSLARCVEQVFTLLPLDLDAIPERATVVDATVNIQAFVMNAFGFCENVAWVWVHELGVTRPDGRPLAPSKVGLAQKYKLVRQSLTQEFRDYLDGRADWFENLTNFRDALAHRIPLFIPPYTLHPDDADKYLGLETRAIEALRAHDFAEHERLEQEKMSLARFQPIMTHSLIDYSGYVVFHPQLLADFNTLEELVSVLLDELDRATI